MNLQHNLFEANLSRLEGRMNSPLTASKRDESLILTSSIISQNQATSEEATFFHSILCQVGLPRSKVEGISFERRCGEASLLVKAGEIWDGEKFVSQPIPYGPLPRLILSWMNTFALRNKTQEIAIGSSSSEFMKMLGKKVTGGKTGTIHNFKNQIQSLSACSMVLGLTIEGRAHTFNGRPIKHFKAWIGQNHDDQKSLWPRTISFSDEYYHSLCDRAVPLDIRAFSALKGSALSMDIYCWMAQRLHRINGRPVLLHWTNLREQFGQEYGGKDPAKDFKKSFVKALNQALAVYPLAKVKIVKGGLLLMASPPPIPYRV